MIVALGIVFDTLGIHNCPDGLHVYTDADVHELVELYGLTLVIDSGGSEIQFEVLGECLHPGYVSITVEYGAA